MTGERGAGFPRLVAQADHAVKPLAGNRLDVHRLVTCDVDAIAIPHHRRGIRVQRLGTDARAEGADPRPGTVP
jgi:hypothetical protein